jgi:peptide/nickel transport system substrate-binding protein
MRRPTRPPCWTVPAANPAESVRTTRRVGGTTMKSASKGLVLAAVAAGLLGACPLAAQERPFVVALNHEPETTDPAKATNLPVERPMYENIVEPLIGLSHDGSLRQTLSTWEVSDDNKVITFKLKSGVKFHSGDPLTTRDVEFSHLRMMENPNYQRTMRNFDHLEIVDDLTVRFVFKVPTLSFLTTRQLVLESKAYHDRVGEQEFSARAVGTGPYKLVNYVTGQYADLEAFDGYWGPKPAIKKVRFAFVKADDTRIAMLKAGEADLIVFTPYTNVPELTKAGFKSVTSDVHPTVSIDFQTYNKKMPWADVRVREAIAHAIDADAIIKGLFAGIPKHYARLAPGEPGYDPSLKPYPYDVALAKKLLADAGYAKGFAMPLVYWANTYGGIRETAEAVTLYLKAVGIDTKIEAMDVGNSMARMRTDGKNPNAELVQLSPKPTANFYDPSSALAIAFSSNSPLSTYDGSAEFNGLVAKGEASFDDKQRGDYVRQAMKILQDDVATVPLWNGVVVYSMKPSVSFTPTQRNSMMMYLTDVRRD